MINTRENQGDASPIDGPFGHPNPEIKEKKSRRRFTAKYKLRLLEEVDACTEPGRPRPSSRYLSSSRGARDQGRVK